MLISQQKITPRLRDFFGKTDKGVVKKYVPKNYLYWVGSGREALKQILLNVGGNVGGKKVGIPAYTCHVVLDAVKRAGCEPVFYDSGAIAEIKDIEKIIGRVDMLVVSYNFGFLPEMDKIVELCKKNKVILIEDCAQALGATYNNKLAGSFGDYAFYSFGISKNIGFCGGLIASDKKLEIKRLKNFPTNKLVKVIGEVLISNVFFDKWFYPFTKRFLRKELIKKQEALDYDLPRFAKKVILNQFGRYSEILRRRTINAEYCCKQLAGVVDFVKPIKNSSPTWLYFTVKEPLINKLLKENVEIGEMKTFKCLDGKSEKALMMRNKVLTFALYRDFREIKFIVNKIKKVTR